MILAKTWASGRNSSVPGFSALSDEAQRSGYRVADVGEQVLVGEFAALGPPGGARGVDDGGQVGRADRGGALADGLLADLGAGLDEGVHRRPLARLDHPHVLQGGHPVTELADQALEGGRLDEGGPRAGVAQDPFGLLGRGGLVDGHGHRARAPDRVVDQRPLVPGVRHQRHPVAGLDPGRDQPLGDRHHLVPELLGGHVRPLPGQARGSRPAQHHGLRLLGGPAEDGLGEIRGRGDLHQGGNTEFAHSFSSG